MNSEKLILSIAAIVMLVAALSLGFTYYSVANFKNSFLTGYVTANGTIYINITSAAAINFTTNTINWGTGRVNESKVHAVLSTAQGTVINGTWTPVTQGFVVENTGNVNVSLSLKTGKTNQSFIGGTNPMYQFNVSNIEAGSCIAASGFTLATTWNNANTTGVPICSNFSYIDARDTIKIDIRLRIPYDAPATGVIISDQIELTADQSA